PTHPLSLPDALPIFVPLRLQGDTERDELGTIGIEPARKSLVRHLLVALDVRLDVPGGQWTALGHEEGDERELADELVGVVRHARSEEHTSELQSREK